MSVDAVHRLDRPLLDAFRFGVLDTLDIPVALKDQPLAAQVRAAAADGVRNAALPYVAGRRLATEAKEAGRESELLSSGATDADPKLAAAYASGWVVAQRNGPRPVARDAPSREKWVALARSCGFDDERQVPQPSEGGILAALKKKIDVPHVGAVPTWGLLLGGAATLGLLVWTVKKRGSTFSVF